MQKKWIALIVAAVVIVLVAGSILAVRILGPQDHGDMECLHRMGITCTDVTPDAIGRIADMTLPEGTTVEDSRYRDFQDWHLEARFVVPADRVGEWEASLDGYEPATADACLTPSEGTVCADRIKETGQPSGSYERTTREDGSVEVSVEAFTS